MVIELGERGYSSASAHCVCVVVRTLCVSLCRCSFVCTSFDLLLCVTCCDLDVTISESERRREGVTTTLVCAIQKKRRNKEL